MKKKNQPYLSGWLKEWEQFDLDPDLASLNMFLLVLD